MSIDNLAGQLFSARKPAAEVRALAWRGPAIAVKILQMGYSPRLGLQARVASIYQATMAKT